MDLHRIAKDTGKVLASYVTYQALRTILTQLSETDPPVAFWLQQFSANSNVQDGDVFIQELLKARQDLGFRLMTVREHIAAEIADYLPEMLQTGIQQSNLEHRCRHLERITQLSTPDGIDPDMPSPL